jgi:hypothetical protein
MDGPSCKCIVSTAVMHNSRHRCRINRRSTSVGFRLIARLGRIGRIRSLEERRVVPPARGSKSRVLPEQVAGIGDDTGGAHVSAAVSGVRLVALPRTVG